MVLNTEYAKLHVSQDSTEDDIPLTEERLADELLNLRVWFHLANIVIKMFCSVMYNSFVAIFLFG